jgi:hypothetical protein
MTLPVFNPLWQQVTCSGCGREYTCTPEDDCYGAHGLTSGVCFACLLRAGGLDPDTTPVQVVDLSGRGGDPRDLSRRPGGAP